MQDGSSGFDPSRVETWLTIAGIIVGAAVSAAGMVWKAVKGLVRSERKDRVTADEERDRILREVADTVQTLLGKMEIMREFQTRSEVELGSLRGHVGRLEGRYETILGNIQRLEIERLKEVAELRKEFHADLGKMRDAMNVGFAAMRRDVMGIRESHHREDG